MQSLGIFILLTFVIYYIIALATKSEHVLGTLLLGAILSLGVTLTFF